MNIPESVEQLPTNGTRGRVYGEPYRTADGGTVIPVAKVRAGTATPMGLFVIYGGTARWVPAVDTNRIALIGIITGLISAMIGSAGCAAPAAMARSVGDVGGLDATSRRYGR